MRRRHTVGDTRVRVRFAWLPRCFAWKGNVTWVWLEFYESREVYVRNKTGTGWAESSVFTQGRVQ